MLFKPGQYYASAAVLGAFLYVGFRATLEMNLQPAAIIAGGVAILVRLLAVRYDWRTSPWFWWHEHGGSVG